MSSQAVVKLVEELKQIYSSFNLLALMYPYLLTTDGKKDFSPTVIEETIGKICKKNKFIYGTERLSI